MNKTGYGLIGCGMMGHEHIHNIQLLPGTEIRAVYDPVAEQAASAAQIAGGATICERLDDMLTRDDIDALVIVSPNDLHVAQLQQIAAHAPRPILCEKPLYAHPHERDALDAFAASYDAPVWVAMEYRYMPPIAAFLQEAEKVTGGIKMLSIREHRFPFLDKVAHWNRFHAQTGGTFVEKCCHFFDLMRVVLRDEPVRVMASASQAVNFVDETVEGKPADMLDNGYVILDFAKGARALLDLCMFAEGSRYQEELCAAGPMGKLECFVPGPGRFWPEAAGPAPIPKLDYSPRSPKMPQSRDIPVDPELLAAGDHNGATFYQHQRFLQVIKGEGDVDVTLHDGIRSVEIALAAQESAATGQAIVLG